MLASTGWGRIVKLALMQAERAKEIRGLSFKNPLRDGQAGKRIAQSLKNAVEEGLAIDEPDLRDAPMVEYRLLDEMKSFKVSLFDLLAAFDRDGKPVLPWGNKSKFIVRIKCKPMIRVPLTPSSVYLSYPPLKET
ncbi:MAG: hypothetical protein QXH48_07235 [Candidatus Bathyarchaeia archaeon]